MKKAVTAVLSLITIIFMSLFCGISAYAEEDISELYEQVDELMEEYNIVYSTDDIETLSFETLIQGVHDMIKSRITAPFRLLGIIAVIIIFSAFTENMNESFTSGKNNMTNIICVMTAVAVISEPLLTLYGEVTDTIARCGEFISIFVPLFTVICAVSGNVSSIGTYNGIILGASEFIVWISNTYLLPVLTMTMALSVTNSICRKSVCEGLTALLKKCVSWVLTVSTMLFAGFLTVKNTIGAAADGFASKTAKFVISGFVPVIGGAVSDAYSTVKGSIGILKCTAGTAGILIAAVIFIPPLAEIILFRAVMKICGVLADMFSAEAIGKLVKGLESGLAIAMSIMVCFALIFIISTAILMKTQVI